jgi:hypothetical protein
MNKFLAIFVFTFAIAVGDVKRDPVTNERI